MCFSPKLIYGGTMSIHLNPQTKSAGTPETHNKGFWARYTELAEKMHEKEALTSLEYCTRKWVRKTNVPLTEEDKTSVTFQRCMEGHRAHLALSAWINSRYYF